MSSEASVLCVFARDTTAERICPAVSDGAELSVEVVTDPDRLSTVAPEQFDCTVVGSEVVTDDDHPPLDLTAGPDDPPVVVYPTDAESPEADTESLAETVREVTQLKDSGTDTATTETAGSDAPSERVQWEREVLKRAIDAAHTPLTLSDPTRPDNPLVYVNDAFVRTTGYDREAAIGENCRYLQGERTDPETITRLREGIDAEEPVTVELWNYRADGTPFRNRLTVTPIYDRHGELVHFLGSQEDVTETWRAHRDSELVRELLDHSTDLVLVSDPDTGDILDANETACRELGYDREELLSLTAVDVDTQFTDDEAYDSYVEGGDGASKARTSETEFRRADGTTLPVEVNGRIATVDDQRYRLVIARDVSERRRRERRRRALTTAIEELFDADERSEIAETAIDISHRALDLESSTIRLVDETAERLEPIATSDARNGVDRESSPTTFSMLPLDGETPHARAYERGETVVQTDVSELGTAYDPREVSAVMCLPLGDHGVFSVAATDDGGVTDGDVELTEILAGNVRAALGRLDRERRLRAQRDDLQLLNEMVRHDIRNDLQATLAFSEAITDLTDGEASEYADRIAEGTRNAMGLTQTARDLGETMLQPERSLQAVPLRTTIESQLDEVRSTASQAVVTTDGSLPRVDVLSDDMLDSAVRNLLTNAIQHNDSTVPEVELSVETDEETATVEVADNGPGVPDDLKADIFGKGEKGLDSDGTGIGLYLVKTVVENAGGEVWVEDGEPEGAVFGFTLPLAGSDGFGG